MKLVHVRTFEIGVSATFVFFVVLKEKKAKKMITGISGCGFFVQTIAVL